MAGEFAKFFVEIGSKFNPKGLKQAQTSIDKTKKKAGGLSSSLKKLGGIIAGGLIARQMISFAKESFQAFAKQEKAVNNLNSALKNLNIFSVELSKNLQEEASAIQKITTVGDETSLAVMQLGLSTGVSSDQIGEATRQAIGLSKAYGVDLNASMKMVALAQQGEYTILNRYIPQLRSLATDTEKAAMTQKLLAAGFNLAKAETKEVGGEMKQLANKWGDIQEAIVERAVPAIKLVLKWVEYSIGRVDALIWTWDKLFKTDEITLAKKEIETLKNGLDTLNISMATQSHWGGENSERFKELQKEADNYANKIKKAELNLKKLRAVPPAKLPPKLPPDTLGDEEVKKTKTISERKLEVDKWYLSEKGIAEVKFYEWLHGELGNFDALSLEQKETTMKKVQETQEKANSSMTTGFLFALTKLKAQGMGWAQAWDGMFSGVMSGMSSAIKTFITSSGNMFDNFKSLLDGIFKSILDSFISMVSQMIAKWILLNIITGGQVSLFGTGINSVLGYKSHAKGGPITETGPAFLHAGEVVIPADIVSAVNSGKRQSVSSINNNSIGGATTILNQTVNIAGTSETNIDVIARKLTKATRDGLPDATDFAKTSYKIGKNREDETIL